MTRHFGPIYINSDDYTPYPFPCVAITETYIYLLIALVKSDTKYYQFWSDGTRERGGEEARSTEGRVGGIPAGVQERNERTGRAGSGAGPQEEGQVGERGNYWVC